MCRVVSASPLREGTRSLTAACAALISEGTGALTAACAVEPLHWITL